MIDDHMSEMFDLGLALFGAWVLALHRGQRAQAATLHAQLQELKEEMTRYGEKCELSRRRGPSDSDGAHQDPVGVEADVEDVPRKREAEQAAFHVEQATPNRATALARQVLSANRRFRSARVTRRRKRGGR